MTPSATSNIAYMRDFQRSPQSAATKQSSALEQRVGLGTAQSLLMVEPAWENLVWSRLKFLQTLNAGWDGTDAKPLDDFAARFGMKLLHLCLPLGAPAPELSLLRYGGLQFEWFTNNCEFEIEIVGPYRVKAWFVDRVNEEEFEGNFDYEYTKLFEMIQKMLNLNASVAHESTAA
jgi:hypothetical protein